MCLNYHYVAGNTDVSTEPSTDDERREQSGNTTGKTTKPF